ncbi:RNA polymerase sigma factor [Streptomyces hiroshimensis]
MGERCLACTTSTSTSASTSTSGSPPTVEEYGGPLQSFRPSTETGFQPGCRQPGVLGCPDPLLYVADAVPACFTQTRHPGNGLLGQSHHLRQVGNRRPRIRGGGQSPRPGARSPRGHLPCRRGDAQGEQSACSGCPCHHLPPTQRQVMAWAQDGFTYHEIGAALGMEAAAVRKNHSRARARLKQLLQQETGSAR